MDDGLMAWLQDDFHFIEERLIICDELNPDTRSQPGADCGVRTLLRHLDHLPDISDNLDSENEYHRNLVFWFVQCVTNGTVSRGVVAVCQCIIAAVNVSSNIFHNTRRSVNPLIMLSEKVAN